MMFMVRSKKSTQAKVEDVKIFSTGLLGDSAEGRLSLFTVPRGQSMPQLPFDASRCVDCRKPAGRILGEADTNIMQAGQFGSAIGDVRLDRVRAVLSGGDPVSLDVTVGLRIAGQLIMESQLSSLVGSGVPVTDRVVERLSTGEHRETGEKVPFALCARTDTFEVVLNVLKPAKIVGGPLLVKIEFEGKAHRDGDFGDLVERR